MIKMLPYTTNLLFTGGNGPVCISYLYYLMLKGNICYDEVVIKSKLFLQSSIEALIILIYLQFIEAGLPQNKNSVVIVKQYRH